MPAAVRSWLLLDTSMTVALVRAAGSPVQLTLLRDGPGRVLDDERRLLAGGSARARVREVVLTRGDEPLIAARTVHLSRRLHADPQLVALGKRPLGTLLFGTGEARPCRRELTIIDACSPLYRLARGAARRLRQQFFARRTLYRYARQPLLVTEIFLSSICRHQPAPEVGAG